MAYLFFAFLGSATAFGKQAVLNDSADTKVKRYINSIQALGHTSLFTTGVGVRYTGAARLKKHANIGVGPSVFFEKITFKTSIKLPTNVMEASLFFVTPGLNTEFGLNSLVGFQAGMSILIGTETIMKQNAKKVMEEKVNAVGGVQLEQNLVIRTSKNSGFKLGIGIFERFITSSFYEEDFGGTLYIGFQF